MRCLFMKKIRILSILLSCGLLTTSQISASKKFSSSDCLKFSPFLLVPAAFIGAGYGIYRYQNNDMEVDKNEIIDQKNNKSTPDTSTVVMEKDKSKINSEIDRCFESAFKYEWKYLKDINRDKLKLLVKQAFDSMPSQYEKLLRPVVKFCIFLTCLCIKNSPKNLNELISDLSNTCKVVTKNNEIIDFKYEECSDEDDVGITYNFKFIRDEQSANKKNIILSFYDSFFYIHNFSIDFADNIAKISFIETKKLNQI